MNVLLIDADQCPLRKFSFTELTSSHLIACSNKKCHLKHGERYFGKTVPLCSESADTYLFLGLEKALRTKTVESLTLYSRDKKLVFMLLNLVSILSPTTQVYSHEWCGHCSYFVREACEKLGLKYKGKVCKKSPIVDHLSQFPNGLKFKTLAHHFEDRNQDDLKATLSALVKQSIVSCLKGVYRIH